MWRHLPIAGWPVHFILFGPFGATPVAIYDTATLDTLFVHGDHLGSTAWLTNHFGDVPQKQGSA